MGSKWWVSFLEKLEIQIWHDIKHSWLWMINFFNFTLSWPSFAIIEILYNLIKQLLEQETSSFQQKYLIVKMEKTELSHFSISVSGASTYEAYHKIYMLYIICCRISAQEWEFDHETEGQTRWRSGNRFDKTVLYSIFNQQVQSWFWKKKNHKI